MICACESRGLGRIAIGLLACIAGTVVVNTGWGLEPRHREPGDTFGVGAFLQAAAPWIVLMGIGFLMTVIGGLMLLVLWLGEREEAERIRERKRSSLPP